MSKQPFVPADFNVKSEGEAPEKAKIVKLSTSAQPGVQPFRMQQLDAVARSAKYADIKSKYGSLAATDKERAAKSRQDSRFSLSPLLRDPLAVEEEERRVIEEKVRVRVAAAAEEAKAKAIAQGYRDGLKQGHEEAFAEFREKGGERLQAFTGLVEELESAKEGIFRANERFVIELVYKIARMILLKELKTDREYVQRLARDLIERVGVRENITIRISEDDAETIGMIKDGLEKSLGGLKNVNVQISNQVKGGGCIVETEWNAIDASVDNQLKGIFDELVGGTENAEMKS